MQKDLRIFLILLSLISFGFSSNGQEVFVASNISFDSDALTSTLKRLSAASDTATLIMLGNSFHDKEYDAFYKFIDVQKKSFNKVYFVPGRKEWEDLGPGELKKWSDQSDDDFEGDIIVPENACGKIEIKELNDQTVMLFIDSEWYFSDWTSDENFNKGCEIYSRKDFWAHLADEYGALKAKNVLLFCTHPIYRYDGLGGHYPIESYLFPFKDDVQGMYIPLPFLGHLIKDSRNYFMPRQNAISPLYRDFTSRIKRIIRKHKKTTLISSHVLRNTTEFREKSGYHINVNTSKKTKKLHRHRLRYDQPKNQLLHLRLHQDSMQVEFNDIYEQSSNELESVPFLKIIEDTLKTNFQPKLDTPLTRPIKYPFEIPSFSNYLFGSLNVPLYKKEITVDKIDLSSQSGGLQPMRLGGGNQTTSLRFENPDEYVYLARALKKRTENLVPLKFNVKPIRKLMDYIFLSAHPLSFLVTPDLEQAADILHTTPKLRYLPMQDQLKPFNEEIGNELVLFRERADDDWNHKRSFGYSKDIISSKKMIEEMTEGKAKPNAKMYLRARLLDLVINDWDRHSDQWRWAKDTTDRTLDLYSPIPRDRDQAFSHFDGLLLTLLRPYDSNFLQMRKFDDKLSRKEISWMHFKSSYLDHLVLHQLSIEEWNEQKDFIKENLTPEVIDNALNNLPNNFAENKIEVANILKNRMSDLDQISSYFYQALSTTSVVRGTLDKDSILVIQHEAETHVKVYSFNTQNPKLTFDATFNAAYTKCIWIYGLDGDDQFHISCNEPTGSKILLIGGYGHDSYQAPRTTSKLNLQIIDDQKELKSSASKIGRIKIRTNKSIHALGRNDFVPIWTYVMPQLNYHTDDGPTLGALIRTAKTTFKSEHIHKFLLNYRPKTASTAFTYDYRYTDKLTKKGIYFHAEWSGLRRQFNYVGGNESSFVEPIDRYYVFSKEGMVSGGFIHQLNKISEFRIGGYLSSTKIDREESKILNLISGVNESIFSRQIFAGAITQIELKNFDSNLKPQNGARLQLGTNFKYNFQNARKPHLRLNFEYDYYRSFGISEWITVSTKIRAGHIFGDYYLYEGFQLGGSETLRGFVFGRFTGGSSFAQNTNLHVRVINELFPKKIPTAVGVSVSFDHGRVWNDLDSITDPMKPNNTWHRSYGMGVWFSPFDIVLLSAGYHISKEDRQIRVLFNWQF